MAQTQIVQGSRVHPVHCQAAAARGGGSRGRRWGTRLWSLLHAQSILNGTSGGPDGAAFIEDDYRRLAARRAR
jgi:hypothetical protein